RSAGGLIGCGGNGNQTGEDEKHDFASAGERLRAGEPFRDWDREQDVPCRHRQDPNAANHQQHEGTDDDALGAELVIERAAHYGTDDADGDEEDAEDPALERLPAEHGRAIDAAEYENGCESIRVER